MGIFRERESPIRPYPLCDFRYPMWLGDESSGMTPSELDELLSVQRGNHDEVITTRLRQLTRNPIPDLG